MESSADPGEMEARSASWKNPPPDQCPGWGFTKGRESTGPGESRAPPADRPQLGSRKPCPLCFWLLGLCVGSQFFQKPFPDLPPGLPVAELPLFLRC